MIDKKTALGIELGSTRIKAVLTDLGGKVLATGSFGWENAFENGIWTYHIEDVKAGLQACFADLKEDWKSRYGETLTGVGAMGISAMMHGYIAQDGSGEVIAPFRTWRNTDTGEAAEKLTEALGFNIPLRWSAAHLYQRALEKDPHLSRLASVNTLAGYVHSLLTGERVLGVGDASGMFPVDGLDYDEGKVRIFDSLLADQGYDFRLRELFPRVLGAGADAGRLTPEGAKLLDPTGEFLPGVPFCPPEGDAGTGMVATNSVARRTGNLSAGTSTFAMIVLERPLKELHREIDIVTTPDGSPVAMAHANNGTSDIDAWVGVFGDFAKRMGAEFDISKLYETLYRASLEGDADCGGTVVNGCVSAEFIIGLTEGRPSVARSPEKPFTLANLMRAQIYSALAVTRIGMAILTVDEQVAIDRMLAHGGLFKTPGVAQKYLAQALNTPVAVMPTAGEGGPWGMALLAAYSAAGEGLSLPEFLDERIFASVESSTELPDAEGVAGFEAYLKEYRKLFE